MAQQDTHGRQRADADARTLRNRRQRDRIAQAPKIGEKIGDVAMSLNEGMMGEARKYIEKTGPTGQRLIMAGAGALSRLPGYVYDAVKITTAKDKAREALGVVGGRIGSAVTGSRMGALAGAGVGLIDPALEGPAVVGGTIVGGVVGALGGDPAVKYVYDRARERQDAVTQRLGDALTQGLGPNTDAMLRRGLLMR